MQSLVFLGCSHIDPEGYRNLYRALERHHPDIILLEVSLLSVILRKTLGHLYALILKYNLKSLKLDIDHEIQNILNYLTLPFEFRAVSDYCKKNKTDFHLVDVSLFTLFRFFPAYKLIRKKNLLALPKSHNNRFEQEKSIAGSIFNKNDTVPLKMKISNFKKDKLLLYREDIIAKRIIKYAGKHRNRRIVYAGGWEHLLDDTEGKTLYSKIILPKKREIVFLK